MSGSKPAAPPRPARFDFPHIKVDQYGLPDSLMAAIKGSVAFGGQQLESPAMQMNLDLHALATLRNAMKLGERSLYLGDTLQRSSPKSGGPAVDKDLERLLALLPATEQQAAASSSAAASASGSGLGDGLRSDPSSPRHVRSSSSPDRARRGTDGMPSAAAGGRPARGQHLHSSVSDSGQQLPASLQQRAAYLADLAAAAAADRGLAPSGSPIAGPSPSVAGRVRRPSLAGALLDSENAQISRQMQRVMEARGLQSRLSAPSSTDSPTAPLSTPATSTQRLPPAPWGPSTVQQGPATAVASIAASTATAAGASPARPRSNAPESSPGHSPTKLTMRPRVQLGYNSPHQVLSVAAVETGAGLHACLPPVLVKQTQRLAGASRASSSGTDGFMPSVFGQQQVHRRAAMPSASESGAAQTGSTPATPTSGAARRARRASYSIPGQQPATAPGPRRSVDDADASAAPHLPQLPGTGSWNAACASPVAGAAVHHLGKETTRNWRM